MKSLRSLATGAALIAILCFVAASFARAQREKPVPGELKVKPGRETQTSAEGSASPGSKEAKNGDKDKDKEEEKEPPPSVTEHTITVGGKTIHYRATAGYMVMRDWSEKKKIGRRRKSGRAGRVASKRRRQIER